MTDPHDDADLAPVTDLFGGARSRRRGGQLNAGRADGHAGDTAGEADGAWATDAVPGDDERPTAESQADVLPLRRAASRDAEVHPARGDSARGGSARGDSAHDDSARDRAGAEASWLPPVTGDGTGRSARAEQDGYDDDGSADATSASVFAIGTGDELAPEDAPRPLAEQAADAERISMRQLGRRGVSESEMRKALAKHDLDDRVVEDEIDRLRGVALLDDLALATDLVDRLHERKGLGRQGVVAELRRRGIDQSTIDAALEASEDDRDDELERAIELAAKRAGSLRNVDDETAERRLSGFLMRKGYNSGVVRIAVDRALRGGGSRPTGRGTVRFE